MPGKSWVHTQITEDPEKKKRLRDLINSMPLAFQARNHMGIGPEVWDEVREMRRQGLSDHEIAPRFGVAAMTINRGRRKLGIP